MAEIVILANSVKPGGHCIAGIDINSGEWIRPVGENPRAIPPNIANNIELLEVLDIPLSNRIPKDKYHRENRFVSSWEWKKLGRMSPADIMQYCENTSPILHNNSDRVEPSYLERLPFHQWKSLQIILTRVTFFTRLL